MMMRIPAPARRVIGAAGLVLLASSAFAEVTRVEVQRREDLVGGKSFGTAGPYEKIVGRVHFAVDPATERNKIIVDLDKAPRNAQGKVEFSSDLYILKPKDSSRGNGVVLIDVVNRGNFALLRTFSRASGNGASDPKTEADLGDASLLEQGYTLVAVGWQFDVAKGRGLIGTDLPIATDGGKPITGWVKMWFISNEPVMSYSFVSGFNTAQYPPIDVNNPAYRLTVREGIFAPQRVIPRDEWQFARAENGKPVPDNKSIFVKSGLRAGLTYEVAFEAQDPPVAGLGFAAVRDMGSLLKYDANSVAPGKFVYLYGASQTGRFIRQLVYEGFTIDERERKVVDAAFVQTGATGVGSFNERFAQPNEGGSFSQTKFPILYKMTTDPVTGRVDGLGARIPAGMEPKLMLVDTSSEYWDRGRVAALRHTTIDGSDDLEDAPNVRVYLLAGTKHGSGSFPPNDGGGEFKENSNDYRWAQRGLLAAMDAWVRQGSAPPASAHPKLGDLTLVARDNMKWPTVPGIKWPTTVPGGYRADVPGNLSALPFLVPKVDADGNEISGIRLPEQAVPLFALTGWNFRSERIGAPNILIAMAGSSIPLPKTKAERDKTRDPRMSIIERYGSKAAFLKKAEDVANKLAAERYVLKVDVAPMVRELGEHWDAVMGPARPATSSSAGR